jgi:hypothetical protein
VDIKRIPPVGDPFTAAPHHHHDDQDERPHACNDGWITLGQLVVDPETGEESDEHAPYLCSKCGAKQGRRECSTGRGILRGPGPFIRSIGWSIGAKEGRPHPLHIRQPTQRRTYHKPPSVCRNHSFAVGAFAFLGAISGTTRS